MTQITQNYICWFFIFIFATRFWHCCRFKRTINLKTFVLNWFLICWTHLCYNFLQGSRFHYAIDIIFVINLKEFTSHLLKFIPITLCKAKATLRIIMWIKRKWDNIVLKRTFINFLQIISLFNFILIVFKYKNIILIYVHSVINRVIRIVNCFFR